MLAAGLLAAIALAACDGDGDGDGGEVHLVDDHFFVVASDAEVQLAG